MKLSVAAFSIMAFICSSCHKNAWAPVNVGREYGNPKVPNVVSHLPKANQWSLTRTGPHFFLKRILCFDYACRKMIGRRKALNAISFDEFRRRIEKNAKKGHYKYLRPNPKAAKPDSIKKEPEPIVAAEPNVVTEPVITEPAPILKADSLIVLSEVLFETNSYQLKGEHFAALDSLGKFLLAHPTLEVIVSGHTDNIGSERHNVSLSSRRAEVVAEYLIDNGAAYDRVSFEGFGSSMPIAGNETEEGRRKNRRVEILIRNPVKK